MQIKCPHCGLRPLEEFTQAGDADCTRPPAGDVADTSGKRAEDWHAYVYLRANPAGRLAEYWHHAGGCRAWLVVTRDTVTHEIYSVVTAGDHAKSRGGS